MRLTENAHLLRYPRPASLRRTSTYASFVGTSEALHLDIFPQPPKEQIARQAGIVHHKGKMSMRGSRAR
jgi:hypothetical protein